MDDRPYYYRLRGRTMGPVGLRQIRQLAQRAQIGRTTDVSRDGQQWGKAGDFPEIFEVAAAPPPEVTPVSAVAAPSSPPIGPMGGNWYYATNGVQQGPVDLGTLQRMVASGTLAATDHVFPEGGADWLPVSSVPQLAVGATPPIIIERGPPTVSQPQGANGMAIAGFVLAICSLLLSCLCGLFSLPVSVLAIIFSAVGMVGNKPQKGLAIAGLIISLSAVVVAIIVVVIGVALYYPQL